MKISEAAAKFELTPVTLRYYENVGLIPPIKRKNGVRDYDETDLTWIDFIKCMRQVKIPINDLVKYNQLMHEKTDTRKERRQILAAELERLEIQRKELNTTITKLKTKISLYDQGKIK